MMGKLIRCLTRDATVMALFLDSTDMVARAEQIHQPSAVVTAAGKCRFAKRFGRLAATVQRNN